MTPNQPYDRRFDTHVSLLDRLRGSDADDVNWHEFVARYAELLKRWCRTWGVGPSDMDDVVQETLIAVVASLPGFEHRGTGSFRGWMKTIARRCFSQLVQRYRRDPATGALTLEGLQEVACEKLVDSFDEEARRELFALSAKSVRGRVAETTWRAFELSAIEGLSGAEVAERLGVQLATVYVSRGRVQRMITETIASLDSKVANDL